MALKVITMKKKSSHQHSNLSNHQFDAAFGEYYLKWKNWGQFSNFSKLHNQDKAYFISEIKKTKRCFDSHSKVLEIGFGNGSFLRFARDQNWDIFGTEINENLVDLAVGFSYKAICSDNLLAYDDNMFDLIVAFDVLEHIQQEQLPDFINDIKRILKVGGYFIARVPNGDSPFGLINQNGDVTHVTTIGSGKAHYFASHCDFEIIFIGGEAQPLLGNGLLRIFYRIILITFKKILSFITNIIFFPRSKVAFYSPNLVFIFKKKHPK